MAKVAQIIETTKTKRNYSVRTVYEVATDLRQMSIDQLVSTLTGKKYELNQNPALLMDSVIEQMTPRAASIALAAVELYKRSKAQNTAVQIRCSTDIYRQFQPLIGDIQREEFWVMYLNQSNRIIKKVRIASGALDGVWVDVRLVLKQALLCNATDIAIVHNHPSGSNHPSKADRDLTTSIGKAATYMNVRLVDHIIVCDSSFYSFADNGEI